DRVAAERHQLLDEPLQGGVVRGRDFQFQVREVFVRPADVEVQDLKAPAALDDLVEDHVEQLRIDQVPFGLDDLGGHSVTNASSATWMGGGSSSMRYSNSARKRSTGRRATAA